LALSLVSDDTTYNLSLLLLIFEFSYVHMFSLLFLYLISTPQRAGIFNMAVQCGIGRYFDAACAPYYLFVVGKNGK